MIEELRAALANSNVLAFLRVIRAGETSQDESAYRTLFGGERITDLSRHPNRAVTRGALTSTAAGAYQFLAKTWAECASALGLTDFGPASQDMAAAFLIRRRGALDAVIAGRITDAITKCNREWASLPGSPYGQPTRTLSMAMATYAAYGGQLSAVVAPAPATSPISPVIAPAMPPASPKPDPTPQQETPVLPLIAALGQSLIAAFTPLAAEKLQKEIARHTDNPEVAEQITTAIIQTASAATGKSDPLEAVAAAKQDPAVMEQVEQSALDKLNAMAPLLDRLAGLDRESWAAQEASMASAALRAKEEPYDMTKVLLFGALGVVALLILMVAGIVIAQVFKSDSPDTATWSALTGLIGWATGVTGTIYAYRFGTTKGSAAKDVVIGELSKKRIA